MHFEIFGRFLILPFFRTFTHPSAEQLPALKKSNLYVIRSMIYVLKDNRCLDFLGLLLFSPIYSTSFLEAIKKPINDPHFHSLTFTGLSLFDYNDNKCIEMLMNALDGTFDPHAEYSQFLERKKAASSNKQELDLLYDKIEDKNKDIAS